MRTFDDFPEAVHTSQDMHKVIKLKSMNLNFLCWWNSELWWTEERITCKI